MERHGKVVEKTDEVTVVTTTLEDCKGLEGLVIVENAKSPFVKKKAVSITLGVVAADVFAVDRRQN